MLGKKCHGGILFSRYLPTRAVIAIMMFMACWMSYVCRLQMAILVVPMIAGGDNKNLSGACINPEDQGSRVSRSLLSGQDEFLYRIASDEVSTRLRRQDDASKPIESREFLDLWSNRPFDWTSQTRGELLAGYGIGNVPGNLIGGVMAMKFGPRQTILWTSLISALLSLISPILANMHWAVLLVSRMLVGLMGGAIFPACHAMVAKWAPPAEKTRFVWSLQGGALGTIITYPIISALAANVCWESGWYIPAIMMLFWVVIWFFTAYDSPADHPTISEEEKNYILTAQGNSLRVDKPTLKQTPILAIITSIPFICLVLLHFGNLYLIFFYQFTSMLYFTRALGFKLTKGGMLASLPWLARILFGLLFSWLGDFVKRRPNIISPTNFRKLATIFSHLLPGLCLVVVGYVGCSFVAANIFFFFCLGFNGAAVISNLSNNQDLSPNYAGFLYGIMNTIGTIPGIFIPPMVEEITGKQGNTIESWQTVFWIGAGICIFSSVIYMVGGSAKVQSWNDPRQEETRA
ncbi:sialin isoform X2 [Copidosoma floridanum]|uniref:sialin isoform X2 n=1 Tax=Copidosoma floridanum TaxID=29053 RepID=UPI0006C98FA6|nr:sialin isoform X2 [Copidosoma floridanum]